MLNLINTFTGAQLFVLSQDAKARTTTGEAPEEPAGETLAIRPEFSTGLLPNHQEHDVYWDDGSH